MICEKCKANIPDGAKFCPKCGNPAARIESGETGTIKCPQCGTENPSTAKFCKKDGALLRQSADPKKETPPQDELMTVFMPTTTAETGKADPAMKGGSETLAKETEIAPKSGVLVCPACGTENPSTAKFCKKDGTALGTSPTTAPLSGAAPKHQPDSALKNDAPFDATVTFRINTESQTKKKDDLPGFSAPKTGDATGPAPSWQPVSDAPRVTIRQPEPAGKFEVQSGAPGGAAGSRQGGEAKKNGDASRPPSIVVGTRENGSKKWIWIILIAVLAAAGCAGVALYYLGYIGMNPSRVQKIINTALTSKGFGVSVTVDDEWKAKMEGSVNNEADKEMAINMVRTNKYVKDVIDNMVLPTDEGKIRAILSDVANNMAALKTAIQSYRAEKGSIAEATDQNSIKATYGVELPDKYAAYSVSQNGTILATIKNVTDALNGRTLTLGPEPDGQQWKWGGGIDRKYIPGDIPAKPAAEEASKAGAVPAPAVGAPVPPPAAAATPESVKRTINKALKKKGLSNVSIEVSPDMNGLLKGFVYSNSEKSKALQIARLNKALKTLEEAIEVRPPTQPQAVDPAKLEGEINRALRNAGVTGVNAEVKDDLSVILKGSVRSPDEKQRAMQVVKGFRQAKTVRDLIFVVGS